MKRLQDIVYGCRLTEVSGSLNLEVKGIAFDSRKVESGFVFVAIRGSLVDGHQFIGKALELGAVAIVAEDLPEQRNSSVLWIKVSNTSEALGLMASAWYDHPSTKMKIAGVTGTNGKTTVATLLFDLHQRLGFRCGLLSTVENRIGQTRISSTHTTPDALSIQALMAQMVEAGCSHCFMEVSSHAAHQHRISGIRFDVAIFTNITHDHLDYHGTFAHYIAAKKSFFDRLSSDSYALINKDDKNAKVMVQNCSAKVYTYALRHAADYKAVIHENNLSGLALQINGKEFHSRLIGDFNASNLLAVLGTAVLLGSEEDEVLRELSALGTVAGRFDYTVSPDKTIGIVDYAHTPDALENVLDTIHRFRTGQQRIITVVGCGGDRDKTKRPTMAALAAKRSDQVILTSDNPRSEDPETIIAEMKAGVAVSDMRKTLSISDRREAIRAACQMAKAGDIILVAGKGHETYQEIKGVKYPFDDKSILEETFKQMHA